MRWSAGPGPERLTSLATSGSETPVCSTYALEEGTTTRWLPLDDAIAACVRGELHDLKTELGLRRLRAHLLAG